MYCGAGKLFGEKKETMNGCDSSSVFTCALSSASEADVRDSSVAFSAASISALVPGG